MRGLLALQLGCWGDAVSGDRGAAAFLGNEPGEGPTPDEPAASGEPFTPDEDEPATPDEPPPFTRSETDTCSTFDKFRADAR